jgi:hypothetical protein
MIRRPGVLAILAAACVLALGGCDRHRPLPSDPHANAPGSPGTGNPVVQAQPTAPDSPPGGSEGVAGSAPYPGSSGGGVVPGATGKGTADASMPPGAGLSGGMASGSMPAGTGTTASMGAAAAVGNGSSNATTGSSVGNRP